MIGAVDPKNVNSFPGALGDPGDKKRGRAAANMHWELAPDEALIIEFDDHDGFWMLTNMGAFFNSMDYLYRPVSYTPSRTKVGADGKVRLRHRPRRSGLPQLARHPGLRPRQSHLPQPDERQFGGLHHRLVKRAELDQAMPADAARVTPQERAQQLHARFNGIRQRYCS